MFRNLKEFAEQNAQLGIDNNAQLSSYEMALGAVMILLDVAHADQKLDAPEVTEIVANLFREADVGEIEIGELLELAQFLRKDRKQHQKFIDSLAAHLDPESKQIVLGIAWRVILADGQVAWNEAKVATDLRKRLGLTLEQAMRARALVDQNRLEASLKQAFVPELGDADANEDA